MTTIDDLVQARVAEALQRRQRRQQQRAALDEDRAHGLTARHTVKLTRGDQEDAMKIYRRHNCTHAHHTWTEAAQCIWPTATVLPAGPAGPYAALTYCTNTTVTLSPTLDAAQSVKRAADTDGCGDRCTRHHELILLDPATCQATTTPTQGA